MRSDLQVADHDWNEEFSWKRIGFRDRTSDVHPQIRGQSAVAATSRLANPKNAYIAATKRGAHCSSAGLILVHTSLSVKWYCSILCISNCTLHVALFQPTDDDKSMIFRKHITT